MSRIEHYYNRAVNIYHRIVNFRSYPQTQVGPKLSVANLLSNITNIGETLRQVNYKYQSEASGVFGAKSKYFMRQSMPSGELGSLVRIKGDACDVVVIGDLHGNVERLNLILEEFGPKLKSGEISIVFDGDLIQEEKPENLTKTENSKALLRAVIELKNQYSERVHIIPGDHTLGLEGVPPEMRGKVIEHIFNNLDKDPIRLVAEISRLIPGGLKEGNPLLIGKLQDAKDPRSYVPQTMVFLQSLIKDCKEKQMNLAETIRLLESYQQFFDNCPREVIVQRRDSVTYIAHSPVTKDRFPTLGEMVTARRNPSLEHQLRMNKYNETPDPKKDQYGPSNILAAINSLAGQFGLAASQVFLFSGHDKRQSWAYSPDEKVPNYKVIHANNDNAFGVGLIGERLVREKLRQPKGFVPAATTYRLGVDAKGVPVAIPKAA